MSAEQEAIRARVAQELGLEGPPPLWRNPYPAGSPRSLLLEYQHRYWTDESRFKLALFARQTGKDFSSEGEAVEDCLVRPKTQWMIAAPSERQALDSLDQGKLHAEAANLAIADYDEEKASAHPESQVKAATITFANGSRMVAVPGRPDTVRGKSANVLLTEFDFFENPADTWRAILPSITNPLRGGEKKVRLITTPNGAGGMTHKLWTEDDAGRRTKWSRHKVTIWEAVLMGLPIDPFELREIFNDPDGWAQEYECQFLDINNVLLPYDLIALGESADASEVLTLDDLTGARGLVNGIDFGRTNDPTVCWTLHKQSGLLMTRQVNVMKGASTPDQFDRLCRFVEAADLTCYDYTGPGIGLGDMLVKRFGEWKPEAHKFGKVELCTFTTIFKRELFPRLRRAFRSADARAHPREPRDPGGPARDAAGGDQRGIQLLEPAHPRGPQRPLHRAGPGRARGGRGGGSVRVSAGGATTAPGEAAEGGMSTRKRTLRRNGRQGSGGGRSAVIPADPAFKRNATPPGGQSGAGNDALEVQNITGRRISAQTGGKSPLDAAWRTRARQTRHNPIRGLSAESLARALDAFDYGDLRGAALLWEQIARRDDMIPTVKAKRERALTRRGWKVMLVEKTAEAEAQQAALEHFWNNATAVNAYDRNEQGGVRLVLQHMMQAVTFRYAAQHLVWKPEGETLTALFEYVPLSFFENRTGELRFCRTGTEAEGEPLAANEWLVTCGEGLMFTASILHYGKRCSLQDWEAFCEKFGLPGVLGKTRAAKGSPEWEAMLEAVAAFMNDWGAVAGADDSIELIQAQASTGQIPMAVKVERADRMLAALWRGADLSTLSSQTGADSTGAGLQDEEAHAMAMDDAALISEAMQEIDRRVLEWHFGPGVNILAYTIVPCPERKDLQVRLAAIEKLTGMGLEISQDEVREDFGFQAPEDGDELLEKAQPEPAAAPGARSRAAEEAAANAAEEAGWREFLDASAELLARARVEDLGVLRVRLANALDATFPEPALRALLNDFPALLPQTPAQERAFERLLASAVSRGWDRLPADPAS
ncbi:MAG: DUF935 family protein [Polyangiaceae bacterium]